MPSRIAAIVALVFFTSLPSSAGGPAFVAGSGYNPGVEGSPLLWANASVEYFTDQGDLSPILNNSQANAFVASTITTWTTIPSVGLTVTWGGQLAEDVNGGNIQVTNGVITAPADITPQATGTPLGIVYDYDGTVTDAILGQGAGDLDQCFTNAVYGGPDNFAATGNIAHALIIINGVCAATNAQLPDVQYRLVRFLARCFGLGWSQANDNVLTGDPQPTLADYEGFPVMHFLDPISCVPITICYGGNQGVNVAAPKMDDITAMARLYPAPGGNPQPAGRIWGNVYFTDSSGNATQQMQGVNVVARLMVSNQPSREYVVTSVSGFEFVGNAGNIITGYVDQNGLRYDRFGSNNTAIEGFYDLGQLTIPSGQTIAEYQLTIEPIDPTWSWGLEPYAPAQVAPSGSFAPIVVTVANGSNAESDILMLGSEIAETHPGSGSSYTNPAPLPLGGGWASWLSPYSSTDWFQFTAQANRTASIAVTALDESGNPTESKSLPIIGVWELSDESQNPAPSSTPSAFNSQTFGMTRLDVEFSSTEAYRVGIADYRGDGRPDYAYQASVLYSDSVTPARLSVAGGVTTLAGLGFEPGLQVSAGNSNGSVLSQSATEMQVALPGAQDGTATIQVTDPVTGSFSEMILALTYGAAASDTLKVLAGGGQSSPVGAQAPYPVRVRVLANDGVTPVNGATIAWSATNGVQFSACSGAVSCSVLSDGAGEASTWATPTAVGQSTISAALAPLSYSPPATAQATLTATSTTLDLAAVAPTSWIAQGATLSIPLTVETLDLGAPKPNVQINYTVTQGTATLSSSTATTNSSGFATVNAQLTNLAETVQVSACVAPGNNPCQTFTVLAVNSSKWFLETVSGAGQVVPANQSFQPLTMRVTNGSAADNPVLGATVTFVTTLERNPQGPGGGPPQGNGDQGDYQSGNSMPIILGTSQAQAVTDQNGLASITPSVGSFGPCNAFITVTAGSTIVQLELESVDPITAPLQPHKKQTGGRARPGIAQFSAQASPEEMPSTLFAVPQGTLAATTSEQSPDSSATLSATVPDSPSPPDPTLQQGNPSDAVNSAVPVADPGSAVVPETVPGAAPQPPPPKECIDLRNQK